MMQRGMPTASRRQHFSGVELQTLEPPPGCSQQLFAALQTPIVTPSASRALPQTEPGSRHASPLSQRPNSWVETSLRQVTKPIFGSGEPDQPQQSLSARQRSPVGWQPEAAWQTLTLVAAYGAHERVQHAPPQAPVVLGAQRAVGVTAAGAARLGQRRTCRASSPPPSCRRRRSSRSRPRTARRSARRTRSETQMPLLQSFDAQSRVRRARVAVRLRAAAVQRDADAAALAVGTALATAALAVHRARLVVGDAELVRARCRRCTRTCSTRFRSRRPARTPCRPGAAPRTASSSCCSSPLQQSALVAHVWATSLQSAASARLPSIVEMKPSVPLSRSGSCPCRVAVPRLRRRARRRWVIILASTSDEDDVHRRGGREQTKCSPGKLPHYPDPPCMRVSAAK